jgi:hypothetical protein
VRVPFRRNGGAKHWKRILEFICLSPKFMAALMGTLPIALGWGAGAEARRPLGVAVVGGLLLSQLLTLYITPVFHVWMEWLRHVRNRVFGRVGWISQRVISISRRRDVPKHSHYWLSTDIRLSLRNSKIDASSSPYASDILLFSVNIP